MNGIQRIRMKIRGIIKALLKEIITKNRKMNDDINRVFEMHKLINNGKKSEKKKKKRKSRLKGMIIEYRCDNRIYRCS